MTVDWSKIVFKSLTIKGIYGREMFDTWHKMLMMLQSGLSVRGVITHRLPAERYADGFAAMRSGEAGKVVMSWDTSRIARMTIVTDIVTRIDDVDAAAYLALRRACGASAFYDPRLLGAVERSPLLPADKAFYVVAYDGPRLAGFVPIYLQSPAVVDPFGVLAQTTSARFEPDARGLFSHVMHCYDSTILYDGGPPVLEALFERLTALGRGQGTQHFVIMNVAEGPLLAAARSLGLNVSYMFDRFHLDLAGIDDFETLIARKLPQDGRHEMRRQLRKFAASGARAVIETVPFARLDELTELCHLTTARRGTPQYLPPAPLAHLVRSCGDMIRLVVVYDRRPHRRRRHLHRRRPRPARLAGRHGVRRDRLQSVQRLLRRGVQIRAGAGQAARRGGPPQRQDQAPARPDAAAAARDRQPRPARGRWHAGVRAQGARDRWLGTSG